MKKYCEFCEENHAVEIRKNLSLELKGVKIEYLNISLYCPVVDEGYYVGNMLDENLDRCREAFKKVTGVEFNDYIMDDK